MICKNSVWSISNTLFWHRAVLMEAVKICLGEEVLSVFFNRHSWCLSNYSSVANLWAPLGVATLWVIALNTGSTEGGYNKAALYCCLQVCVCVCVWYVCVCLRALLCSKSTHPIFPLFPFFTTLFLPNFSRSCLTLFPQNILCLQISASCSHSPLSFSPARRRKGLRSIRICDDGRRKIYTASKGKSRSRQSEVIMMDV